MAMLLPSQQIHKEMFKTKQKLKEQKQTEGTSMLKHNANSNEQLISTSNWKEKLSQVLISGVV